MKEKDDSLVRVRVAALSDEELVRMLTRDADSYSVPELRIAKAEARNRKIDLDAVEPGRIERARDQADTTADMREALRQSAPADTGQLARPWIGILILAVLVGCEFMLVGSGGRPRSTWWWITIGAFLLGYLEYMRMVYRLHGVLRAATEGRYPITPAKAAAFHLIPILQLFWMFEWSRMVSRFMEQNGSGKRSDRRIVVLLFWMAILLGYLESSLRLLCLLGAVWFLQWRLHAALAARGGILATEPADFGSDARV